MATAGDTHLCGEDFDDRMVEHQCSRPGMDAMTSSTNANAQMKSCVDDVLLVGGSTRIPKVQQLLTEHFGKELCKVINADQAIAYGAALQAAILTRTGNKDVPALLLQDGTPLPLIVTMNEREHHLMVPMNAAIPLKREQRFRCLNEEETLTVGVFPEKQDHFWISTCAWTSTSMVLLNVWLHRNNAEGKITIPVQRLSGEEIQKTTLDA
ncbi:hypothetical protein EJ110_NYTH05590 [Nymphaea thermarum]|nr:hypothetical protein EJ110_NYTH05590 [Nymphaea thermarum]